MLNPLIKSQQVQQLNSLRHMILSHVPLPVPTNRQQANQSGAKRWGLNLASGREARSSGESWGHRTHLRARKATVTQTEVPGTH